MLCIIKLYNFGDFAFKSESELKSIDDASNRACLLESEDPVAPVASWLETELALLLESGI